MKEIHSMFDSVRLNELGYEQELVRSMSFLGVLGMGISTVCLPFTVSRPNNSHTWDRCPANQKLVYGFRSSMVCRILYFQRLSRTDRADWTSCGCAPLAAILVLGITEGGPVSELT